MMKEVGLYKETRIMGVAMGNGNKKRPEIEIPEAEKRRRERQMQLKKLLLDQRKRLNTVAEESFMLDGTLDGSKIAEEKARYDDLWAAVIAEEKIIIEIGNRADEDTTNNRSDEIDETDDNNE